MQKCNIDIALYLSLFPFSSFIFRSMFCAFQCIIRLTPTHCSIFQSSKLRWPHFSLEFPFKIFLFHATYFNHNHCKSSQIQCYVATSNSISSFFKKKINNPQIPGVCSSYQEPQQRKLTFPSSYSLQLLTQGGDSLGSFLVPF